MNFIKLSVRIICKDSSGSVFIRETEGAYSVDHIIGVLKLAVIKEGEPPTQVLTVGGPVDSYDSYEKVLKLLTKAGKKIDDKQ